jgi:hypothetical protein
MASGLDRKQPGSSGLWKNLKKRTTGLPAQRLKGVRREAPISLQACFGFGRRAERIGCRAGGGR